MRENGYGRIVNIASNVILAGTPNLAHYVASKGGVLGVHARARARARAARHHGQLGRAGPDRDRGRAGEPARGGVRVRPDAPVHPAPRRGGRHRAGGRVPRVRGGRLGDRPAARRRRRACRTTDGEARRSDPRGRGRRALGRVLPRPRSASRSRRCTTTRRTRRSRSPGARLSLAEQGHPAEDRPGVELAAPADPSRADVVLVVEVDDARAEHARLGGARRPLPRRARTSRRGAAAGSSASTRTATSSRSSSPHEGRRPAGRRATSASRRSPDPAILEPTATRSSRVRATAICGADLFPFHGMTPGFEDGTVLGHEFAGVVVEVGARRPDAATSGERVVNTSMISDGTCPACRAGRVTQCDGPLAVRLLGRLPAARRRPGRARARAARRPRAARRCRTRSRTRRPSSSPTSCPTGYGAVVRGGVARGRHRRRRRLRRRSG